MTTQKVILYVRLYYTTVLPITALILALLPLYAGQQFQWHLYVTVPVCVLSPIAVLISGIIISDKWLIPWAYLNVNDVAELKKARGITGNDTFQPERVSNEQIKAAIMKRLSEYTFEDDPEVLPETVLYNKLPYKQQAVIMSIIMLLLSLIPLFMYPSETVLLLLPIIPAIVTAYLYFRYTDSSPLLTLSEKGIATKSIFIPWQSISECRIIRNKQMRLYVYYESQSRSITIDNLNSSAAAINHMLHVYEQRYKAKGE